MRKIKLEGQAGITLIELIIALALLSVIVGIAFSMFSFGNLYFKGGSSQYGLQNDVRFAVDKLLGDLRYAKTVDILDPTSFTDETISNLLTTDATGTYINVNQYDTYFFYYNNYLMKLRRKSLETVKFNTNDPNPLQFKPAASSQKSVEYMLSGLNSGDGRTFVVTSDILLLNVPDTGIGDTDAGYAIKYQSPDSYLATLQFPTTNVSGDDDKTGIDVTFTENIKIVSVTVVPNASASPALVNDNVIFTPTVGGTSKQFSVEFNKLTGSHALKQFNSGDAIVLKTSYGPDFEYEATYTFTFVSPEWSIH